MKEWLEQLCPEIDDWQVDLICEQVAKEVAAEREACARMCETEDGDTPDDQTDCTWSKAARHCAAAIRARGEGK